ncbi:MAG TPA: HEAT repeat domain-containing protein [Candidatus Acidoferrum sp.]|nr:HEAT repeat domain-containing protein [Candidatus Acidoferrum sp.]
MSAPQPFSCKEVASLLVFYACAETSEQENALIEMHLATCATCAAQLAEERGLHESLMEALQASEQMDTGGILLSQCRSELAEALDDLSAPPMQEHWRPTGWLRRWMALRPVPSGALLVLFGAAVGAQLLPWISARLDSGSNGQTVNVSPSAKFTDEQLSKMAVAGINWTRTPDGTLGALQVHVRTEEPLVLSGNVDDPDLRRVLTYVVENGDQTEPGVRLDCLEALRARAGDVDVRRALLFAARKDQNPAVRMKALESLRDAVTDKTVRETLVDALEHDANPGVRVEAVNLLVRSLEQNGQDGSKSPEPVLAPDGLSHSLDPSMEHVVRTLEELQRSDPNRYVRLRSAAALRQIGPREEQ